MKHLPLVATLLCTVAYATAATLPRDSVDLNARWRREAEPQGTSLDVRVTKPFSGPEVRPSWDVNVNRNILNGDRATADIFAGIGKQPGLPVQPHVGVQGERSFGAYGFIRGYGHVQRGMNGGLSPTLGANAEFRFRRAVQEGDEEEAELEEE